MSCLNIPVPDSLKEALEFLDVMHHSFNGSKQGVKKAFEKTSGHVNPAEFNDLTLALTNACELRARIVGYHNVSKYGKYTSLEDSGNDEACGFKIISILKILLPKLITTLTFLFKKVRLFDDSHWGGQRCDGLNVHRMISDKRDFHLWLTDKHVYDGHILRGYGSHWLSPQTGNGLQVSLEALVGGNNGHLQTLWQRIEGIAPSYLPPIVAPPSPPPGPPQTHQGGSHTPAETQPSQSASSSTATIGGAVGATSLVGGGAAVYFLNVGGIRTLIAG
ncbi:uncharacterized protein BcabD6B2_05710 [Babesia caballi]|uniref:Uncharacterized protein n=1 Tax=Babesia caballi TaxID=5871 RepID=A0AAV4LPT9_BABCB|nr:hypothetical protein, conserved [Babesia caballi]